MKNEVRFCWKCVRERRRR